MIVISSKCEEFPDAIRWRFFTSLRSVQNDSHVIPSKGVSPTRNPLLHIHFNRDSSSLRSSEWHRLSSRTYVRDLTIDSFGWRFFKAKPFRMTLYREGCILILGKRFFLLTVVKITTVLFWAYTKNLLKNIRLVWDSSGLHTLRMRFICYLEPAASGVRDLLLV